MFNLYLQTIILLKRLTVNVQATGLALEEIDALFGKESVQHLTDSNLEILAEGLEKTKEGITLEHATPT
jgi:hypothetical protein